MKQLARQMSRKEKIRPWDKKKTPTGYRLDRFSQNKQILIVCEGQTEKEYFDSFDVVTLSIKCIDTRGRSKTKLIDFCDEKVAEFGKKGTVFDEIWCVFDMDVEQNKKQHADFDKAIARAIKSGYKAAYSNDCFELWFYLHYNYIDQPNLRSFYYNQLSRLWSIDYENSGKSIDYCRKIADILLADKKADQQKAIQRAEKLYSLQKNLPCSQQNPITTVYMLVNLLNENLRGVKRG